jgi:secondary thiamine-phosphate synthase enzyme
MGARVVTREFEVATSKEGEVIDVTGKLEEAVGGCGLSKGLATVFVVGSTAAVTTIEYEPGLVKDFPAMLERVAPRGAAYEHQRRWHDGNGHSHVKASLVGPSLSVPFVGGAPVLGEWQQVVLVELDVRPRARRVVVQLVGE